MALIDLDQANAYETAALPGYGDTNAGAGGLTTSGMTNESNLEAYGLDTYTQSGSDGVSGDYAPPDRAVHLAPQLAGSSADHPFWTVVLIAAILFTYKATVKNESSENVKVSFPNGVAITGMSMLGFLFAKWVTGIWQLPSITPTMDYL